MKNIYVTSTYMSVFNICVCFENNGRGGISIIITKLDTFLAYLSCFHYSNILLIPFN